MKLKIFAVAFCALVAITVKQMQPAWAQDSSTPDLSGNDLIWFMPLTQIVWGQPAFSLSNGYGKQT